MISLIFMILVGVGSFIAGTYYEKSNSIRKTKPLKDAFRRQNDERTIITSRDEPYKHTEQEIKDMFNKK